MKSIKKIFENIKLKWLRETGLTILLIAIIIGLFIGINIGVEKLNFTDIDLTKEKLYTLTDISKEQIAKIPKEEEIKIYLFGYIENSSVADLVKQYMKINDSISMEIINTIDRPDLVAKYEVEEEMPTVVVTRGEKSRVFGPYDLYIMDYNTQTTIDITEQRITNGILAVSSMSKNTTIYMLTGHEESIAAHATMKSYLELENYDLKDLDLLVQEKVPEECEILIISSPKSDFTELEANKIKEYINIGGSILWMNDPNPLATDGEHINIQSVLDLYGVKVDDKGIMIEQDTSKMVMQVPDIILPIIQGTDITAELATEGKVMFPNAAKLSFVNDEKFEELKVVKTDLLSTSDKAFFRKDLSISSITPTGTDEVGRQIVGASLEKTINESENEEEKVSSKLIIYANNVFATDKEMKVASNVVPTVYFYNNLDLVMNSVAYLAKAEDQITIRKNIEVVNYTATEAQNTIVMTVIFGVPILIVIVGIVVWQLRRRKK